MRGWAGWPLTTTGQPAASAEAVSPPAVEKASGKLLAPKTATGPSGTIRWRMSARGSGARSGMRRVDADAEVVTSPYDVGEHPQLAGRAADLAGDAADREVALGDGGLDDRVLVGLDLGGDRVEEGAALLGGGGAVRRERLGGSGGGGLDVGVVERRCGRHASQCGVVSGRGPCLGTVRRCGDQVAELGDLVLAQVGQRRADRAGRATDGGEAAP